MERITPKEVTSMMEAVATVYTKEEVEQEVISEEVAETELVLENDEYEKLDENLLQLLTRNRTVYRRDPETGEKIRVDQQRDPKNPDKYIDKKTSGTGDYGYRDKEPGEAGDGTMGNFVRRTEPKSGTGTDTQEPQQRPQSPSSNLKPGNPNVAVSPKTGEETKFERRMPTMAELRAAQAARAKAKAAGASDKEAGYQATKAGVGVAKGTVKDPKIAADANRKAELERIRQRAASQTRAGVRPTVASTADSKSRTAAGTMSNKSASGSGPGGYQTPASARPLTSGNAAARAGATPAVKAPASAAASPAGAGSVASRLAAIRAAKSAATQPTTAKPASAPSTTGATTTPTVKPVSTTPTAQVRGEKQ